MRKIIYFLLALLVCTSCKDNETAFQPTIGSEAFSFKPIYGGAIMHYKLPANNDIIGLNIRYKDFQGKEIVRAASAFSDSLELVGFNQAVSNVPAEVRLTKRTGEESAPIAVSFSTKDSAPYSFFDHLKVLSGWNGFTVMTDNKDDAKGMAHVFYIGKNPQTSEPDTILISSFNIKEGKDTLDFALQQKSEVNTIVIRTEDFRGYMVREECYPNIASYNTAKLDPSKFDFYCDKSVEDDDEKFGIKYLFDGDTKGTTYFDDNKNIEHYYMFLAGPEACGTPMYIDLRKNIPTAQVRMYAMCNNSSRMFGTQGTHNRLFGQLYIADKYPCNVDIYAAKDDHGSATNWNSKEWKLVGSYKQDPDIDPNLRWCKNTFGYSNGPMGNSKVTLENLDSIAFNLNLLCEGQEDGYRYIKIVVNDVYNLSLDETYYTKKILNPAKYFCLQELEVYTKKED